MLEPTRSNNSSRKRTGGTRTKGTERGEQKGGTGRREARKGAGEPEASQGRETRKKRKEEEPLGYAIPLGIAFHLTSKIVEKHKTKNPTLVDLTIWVWGSGKRG